MVQSLLIMQGIISSITIKLILLVQLLLKVNINVNQSLVNLVFQ